MVCKEKNNKGQLVKAALRREYFPMHYVKTSQGGRTIEKPLKTETYD